MTISETARQKITDAIKSGCSLETAAALAGVPTWTIAVDAAHNPTLYAELEKAEAEFEQTHIKNVHAAGQDPKQWRASTWLLERRFPHHRRRSPGTIDKRQMRTMLEAFARTFADGIPDANYRELSLANFNATIDSLCGPNKDEA